MRHARGCGSTSDEGLASAAVYAGNGDGSCRFGCCRAIQGAPRAQRPAHAACHLSLLASPRSGLPPPPPQERGTILTVSIVCYALTSFVGGYVSGGLYASMDGKQWMRAMVLTAGERRAAAHQL